MKRWASCAPLRRLFADGLGTGRAARRASCVFVIGLACFLTASSCWAPSVTSYHEDLPAYVPDWGAPETRFGYHRAFWNDSTLWRPAHYFNLGLRDGQRLGPLVFEEWLVADVLDYSFAVGPEVGIGLHQPVVTLRGSWQPVTVSGNQSSNGLNVGFSSKRWWQVTALYGTDYRPHGLGWSAGARATTLGVGPEIPGTQ
jgi:hypothetical protein